MAEIMESTINGETPQEAIMRGVMVAKMENENQAVIARQFPRNEKRILEAAQEELELYPQDAAEAYYTIPYKDESGKTVPIEGPSIKAAMALARRWGNCSCAGRIIDDLPDRVIVEGVFLDYETNFRVLRSVSVSKFYVPKATKVPRALKPDRMNMAIQAGVSKALRNAILAGLPSPLVKGYYKEARSLAAGGGKGKGAKKKAMKDRIPDMLQKFEATGVTQGMIEELIKCDVFEVNEKDFADLVGIYNAIKDGQSSVEEIFRGSEKPNEDPKSQATGENGMFTK